MSKKSIPFIEVTNEPFRNCKLKSFQKKTKFQRLLKLDILSCSLVEKCAISCYLSILAQLHHLLLNITLRQATSNFAMHFQLNHNPISPQDLPCRILNPPAGQTFQPRSKLWRWPKFQNQKYLCSQAVMVAALAPWTFQSPLPAASNKQCVLTREDTQVMVMVMVMYMVVMMLNI